jgi:hypothetical protein
MTNLLLMKVLLKADSLSLLLLSLCRTRIVYSPDIFFAYSIVTAFFTDTSKDAELAVQLSNEGRNRVRNFTVFEPYHFK